MSNDRKNESFLWACSVLREKMDNNFFGSITIPMQSGNIGGVDIKEVLKPPVDGK